MKPPAYVICQLYNQPSAAYERILSVATYEEYICWCLLPPTGSKKSQVESDEDCVRRQPAVLEYYNVARSHKQPHADADLCQRGISRYQRMRLRTVAGGKEMAVTKPGK